ncbi:HNH/endonuclease VII fold putative polymorphic toxin [Streptomyces sp. NPDC046939]|uniref:HNH/endonuclease VII fold putative polymorphic toxin n=1 Tax=Streptomyces sp. NPDC046939 TaxID=3155376 RepID=UPI0033DEAAFE
MTDGGGNGGTGGGKDLQAEGLDLVARGLTDALGELKELGMVGMAGAGRGFSDIGLSGLELGHEGVTERFKSFCERWKWGVRALIHEGNEFARGVVLSAGTYYETSQYTQGAFQVGVNSLIDNPNGRDVIFFQDHWMGHQKPGEPGYQRPHVHVRPFEDTRNGQVPGCEEHYPYDPE